MNKRWLSLSLALWLLASAVLAQAPRAVVTGPKEARCGSLVVLDATESTCTGRLWLLAVSPEETSFLPVEEGRQCIFASPVSGAYRFVLVCSGTNANGGPMAAMTTHTVTLTGGTVKPDPTLPPAIPVDPNQKISQIVYIFEKDSNSVPRPVASALRKLNDSPYGVAATEFEEDTLDGNGEVPDQYKIALAAAQEEGLPCLVVQVGDRVVKVIKDPKTEESVLGVMP